jgi:pimeloyl-ACP methyl ester carboxylesterase
MPNHVLTEEPLQFGEGGRLFGILTLPSMPPRVAQELPVFVFLSAGLLHRVGPARLHVQLARELARMGFSSLRVDLAGTGDSPPRPGLTNHESVSADHNGIVRVIDSRLGRLPLVLAGLCSGADNAIRLTPEDPRVIGMVLLDPICFPDARFRTRALVVKYTNPARYVAWLKRRFKALATPRREEEVDDVDYLAIRDLPTREQLRAAFVSIRERGGRALSVFTQSALRYYNHAGQLERVLGVEDYRQFCTELFWPRTEHTFPLEMHRRQLMEEVKTWAGGYVRFTTNPLRSLPSRGVRRE